MADKIARVLAQARKTSGKITVKRCLAPRRQGESQTL
jgi:hypothetical protein